MAEEGKLIEYEDGDLVVEWRPNVCIHSAKCVNGLPNVFKPNEKRWIQTEGATNEEIMAQIKKCPSGALAYHLKGEKKSSQEARSTNTEVKVIPNGPLMMSGKCVIELPDGSKAEKDKVAFCRCGSSSNKPYCDGSHNKVGFEG